MRNRLLTGLILSCLVCLSLAAHEEREQSEENETTQTLDSAYAVIRAGYEQLKPVFKSGCFDCHSDQTRFPWYHSMPIIRSWMDGHLSQAREHLDFSEGFPFSGHARQADNLYSLKEEISSDAMPLWQYRLMHWGAAPNSEEKDSIYAWVDRSLILLASHGQYPFNKPENVPVAK